MEADIVEHVFMMTVSSARVWLFAMIKTMKVEDLTRMLVTIWEFGMPRGRLSARRVYQSPMKAIAFVNQFLADLNAGVVETSNKKDRTPTSGRKQGRIAPPEGRSKVKIDAAVAWAPERGVVAVVCRSNAGSFLGASMMIYEGIKHHRTLEALACREALDADADLLLGQIHVVSNCLEVVDGLHGENFDVFGSILQESGDQRQIKGEGQYNFFCREYKFQP
jgi:hypothetical protein